MSDALPRLELLPADDSDFEALLVLRMQAMRESLDQLGRFDPQRARERLSRGFSVPHTRHIVVDGQRVGFVVLIPRAEDMLLDHFYLAPEAQSRGTGSRVLSIVLAEADALNKPVTLTALKLNDKANRFYQKHGFVLWDESEWEMNYWRPARPDAARAGDG
jgi:GNAT superfamily N-acetyltransferase